MIITKHSLAGHSAAIYNAVCLYNINWKINRNYTQIKLPKKHELE